MNGLYQTAMFLALTVNELEIRERFRSLKEWREWAASVAPIFEPGFGQRILNAVGSRGVADPLSGKNFPPSAVKIEGTNYRETIRAGGLIARSRAVLLEYQSLAAETGNPRLTQHKARIFAPEALTPFALYLRGRFPRFIGSEYASTEQERDALFPIVTQDLHQLTFEDGCFDAVFANDVFEHVYDLDLVLREIARILTQGGALVSTFPFAFQREARIVKARKCGAAIEYLAEPEYHGNPMQPDKGSLVYEIPAWDIVQRARAAGFDDPYVVFRSSARHGILGGDIPGVFVFVARR